MIGRTLRTATCKNRDEPSVERERAITPVLKSKSLAPAALTQSLSATIIGAARMSHCIHAIVAPDSFGNSIHDAWPELPRLRHNAGFSIFPVNYTLIDSKITPAVTPRETGDEFMLLTSAFENYLRQLSVGGLLAYVETEYFGGSGGQGALVFADGVGRMNPEWDDSGTINRALELIGVPRPKIGDRFALIGFANIRGNEDILERIKTQDADNKRLNVSGGPRRI